jgi:hypothetical protein
MADEPNRRQLASFQNLGVEKVYGEQKQNN